MPFIDLRHHNETIFKCIAYMRLYMRAFTITSTLCHAILPRTDVVLTEQEELRSLKDNVDLNEKSKADVRVHFSWQCKSPSDLKHSQS